MTAVMVEWVVGCAASPPPFQPSAPDDAAIGGLPEAELDLFCMEQATYVYNYSTRETAVRAFCLQTALAGGDPTLGIVTDRASCEAYLPRCTSTVRHWPWVSSCGLHCGVRVATVERHRRCVTQTVLHTWPVLASELSCDLFGDEGRLREISARAYPDPETCRYQLCI